jgi:hypothetical protein
LPALTRGPLTRLGQLPSDRQKCCRGQQAPGECVACTPRPCSPARAPSNQPHLTRRCRGPHPGVGEVIKGWDRGVEGMRVGDKRKLVIPPQMAYGSQALPGIPPNSTLEFDVELVDVKG